MENQEITCRLCLSKGPHNFNDIDENIKSRLDVLLLKIDLGISKKPMLCASCAIVLQKCYDFKSTCLATNEYVVAFVNEDDAKLDMEDIYLSFKGNEYVECSTGGYNVCCFCMVRLKNCLFLSLEQEDAVTEKIKLEKCLPEMDLSIIKNPTICVPCHGYLEDYFMFMTNCMVAEETIKKRCETLDTHSRIQMELTEALKFSLKNVLNERSINIEELWKEGETKVEPTTDDFTEVEDKKCLPCDEEETEIKTDQHDFDSSQDGVVSKSYDEPRTSTNNNVSDVKEHQCTSCPYRTNKKSNLTLHLLVHKSPSEVPIHKCKFCSYRSKNKHYLRKHLRVHNDPSEITTYRCDICSYQARQAFHLRRHLLAHKNSSSTIIYKCKSCTFQTKLKKVFSIHNSTHRNPSVTWYQCDSCSFKTMYESNLRMHRLTHNSASESTVYQCDSCQFQTKHKKSLIGHNNTHKNRIKDA